MGFERICRYLKRLHAPSREFIHLLFNWVGTVTAYFLVVNYLTSYLIAVTKQGWKKNAAFNSQWSQEIRLTHNSLQLTPARAWTWTTPSRVKRTNHEATMPPQLWSLCCVLRQDALLSQCFSSPRCTNGYQQICWG